VGDTDQLQNDVSFEEDKSLNNPNETQGGLLQVQNTVDASAWFASASTSTGGSCPQDVPISLGAPFNSFTLPISQFCDRFDLIRAFVLASAALMALWISVGTIRS
jgi:hypothetical protein